MSAVVAASLLGKSPPKIKGERKMHHNVISVCCSSGVNLVGVPLPSLSVTRSLPSGSMCAAGHVPFFPAYSAQSDLKSDCFSTCFQSSQKSSEIPNILTYLEKD